MKCQRCGLINPDTAQRCNCGYDFDQALLKDVKTYFIIIAFWVGLRITVADLLGGDFPSSTWVLWLIWVVIIPVLYSQFAQRKNWARIALMILTFPYGLIMCFSDVREYCKRTMQKLEKRRENNPAANLNYA